MDLNVYLKIESDVVGLVSFILWRSLCPVANFTGHARIQLGYRHVSSGTGHWTQTQPFILCICLQVLSLHKLRVEGDF